MLLLKRLLKTRCAASAFWYIPSCLRVGRFLPHRCMTTNCHQNDLAPRVGLCLRRLSCFLHESGKAENRCHGVLLGWHHTSHFPSELCWSQAGWDDAAQGIWACVPLCSLPCPCMIMLHTKSTLSLTLQDGSWLQSVDQSMNEEQGNTPLGQGSKRRH